MHELIKAAVEVLKYKVNLNLEEINKNETRFKEVMKTIESPERQNELNKLLNLNKNILSENFDFINIQVTLLNFLEKYGDHSILMGTELKETPDPESKQEFVAEPNDYFDYTIAGKLQFNEKHPCFNDIAFFTRLLKYYEEKEEYEKCAELMQLKNSSVI